MASDVRPLGSFDPTSRRKLQLGGVVVAGDGRRFILSAGQAVVQNGATHKANHIRTRGLGQQTPVARPTPRPQVPTPVARPQAPRPVSDIDFYNQATNDPERQLEDTQVDTDLRNSEAENVAQQTSVRARFQRILRGMQEQQPVLQQDLTERSAGRGMLFSGGRLEELGNINRQYAQGVAETNEEQTGALNNLATELLQQREQARLARQNNLLGAVNRARERARDLTPPSLRPVPPVAAPAARPPAPVPARRPAPVANPANVGQYANLPTRNTMTNASIRNTPRHLWTERQREYVRRYGLDATRGR